MSTIEIINVGALANDGTGDPLRTAFEKINNNFAVLNSTAFSTSSAYSVGNTTQVIFQTSVTNFTQGVFQIRTNNTETHDSQDIVLSAQIDFLKTSVKFVGYGTTFSGISLTNFDMDVSGGNVRILVNPLSSTAILYHFISFQITFSGSATVGLSLAPDGYTDTVLTTESGLILTTSQ